MPYVAQRVVRISGRRYMPGEQIEERLEDSKSLHALLTHGYVAGYPDPPSSTSDDSAALEELRAKAKELGIKGYGSMKKETLEAKIAEATTGDGNGEPSSENGDGEGQQQPNGTDESPSTGGDVNDVELHGQSGEQSNGQGEV